MMTKILTATFHIMWLIASTAATTSRSSFSPPLRSSFVAPFATPARLLDRLAAAHATLSDEEAATPQQSMDIRELMRLLEETYPSQPSIDVKSKRQQWARTRSYLYQYRSNLRLNSSSNSSSVNKSTTKKRKRTARNRDPLTPTHIQQIISFLDTTFPNHPELQAHIIQNTPRILSKHHSIESRLVPTVEFLKELYGDMAGSDGTKGSMFFEAIQRNSNLLLVQGVGYVGDYGTAAAARTNEDTTTTISSADNISSSSAAVKVEEYLENTVGISSQGIAKLKKNQPTLFQLSLANKVQPTIEYLMSLLMGRDSSSSSMHMQQSVLPSATAKQTKLLQKIVTTHPNLIELDVNSNLKSTAQFLREYCDLTDSELASVIGSNPSILGLAVDGNLRPKMQLLTNVLVKGSTTKKKKQGGGGGSSIAEEESDVQKTALRKTILKHPQILSLSTSNICTKMDYFDDIDVKSDIDGKSDNISLAARLLTMAPSVYSLSLADNIIPKVDYLAALWGWSSLSNKLCECPLLTLSMDNIQQTLSFYNMTGYIDLPNEEDDGTTGGVTRRENAGNVRSRYIATSLYNRLLPRWNFLLKEQERKENLLGVLAVTNDDDDTNSAEEIKKYHLPTSETPRNKVLLPPLHLLAGSSDEVFCRQLNLSLSEYTAFKEEAAPRLKFNSQFDRWLKTGRPIDLIAL